MNFPTHLKPIIKHEETIFEHGIQQTQLQAKPLSDKLPRHRVRLNQFQQAYAQLNGHRHAQ